MIQPGGSWRPDSHVFGNEVGERVKSVRTAWANACEAAEIDGFQLHGLHLAMQEYDESRRVAGSLQDPPEGQTSPAEEPEHPTGQKELVS
jgi:hypothetical protein